MRLSLKPDGFSLEIPLLGERFGLEPTTRGLTDLVGAVDKLVSDFNVPNLSVFSKFE